MKVSRETWQERMYNLQQRRHLGTKGTSVEAKEIGNYHSHLTKVFIGDSVLDVGCGDMGISKILETLPLSPTSLPLKGEGQEGGREYTGIDAFPVSPAVIEMEVEKMDFPDECFDTVLCFATLDGVCDLEKALEQMRRVCKKNIVFLTGIGIEPDQYHTYKITERILMANLPGFKLGYAKYFTHNVALLEFVKL